jgi:hypothetical protein
MKTLLRPTDRASLDARLAQLTPDRPRRWGRMTAPQMICHLNDSFRGSLGDLGGGSTPRRTTLFGRTLMKWWALHLPWPHGIRTAYAADQERGGTPPSEFDRDRATLLATMDRFVRELPALRARSHYYFGMLSEAEWARWGYQHVNHHLRQFGL